MSDGKRDNSTRKLTRRGFIDHSAKLGVSAALSPLVLQLAACSEHAQSNQGKLPDSDSAHAADSSTPPASSGDPGRPPTVEPGDSPIEGGEPPRADAAIGNGAVLFGLYTGDGTAAMRQAAQRLDFSWLKKGDSVLIKVASNSGNPHPSVTSPAGVRGMIAELKARGAGRIVVADQAGVEWVRRSAKGRFSSTRERFTTNGLIEAEKDAELRFFDDAEFEAGYIQATPPEGHRWPRGMYITSAITEVDHIVYMPRIGAHQLAGLTLAHKMAIGWLRDDSRHDLHNDASDFYEKYTEVSYAREIRDRFRLVVTVAEKILLHGGPDAGTAHAMSPVLVVGSSHLANHDAVASSVLVTLNSSVRAASGGMGYSPALASFLNGAFARGVLVGTGEAGPWISDSSASSYTPHPFESGITHDRSTQRGWELSGGGPDRIHVVLDGQTPDAELMKGLDTHGEGFYAFA